MTQSIPVSLQCKKLEIQTMKQTQVMRTEQEWLKDDKLPKDLAVKLAKLIKPKME